MASRFLLGVLLFCGTVFCGTVSFAQVSKNTARVSNETVSWSPQNGEVDRRAKASVGRVEDLVNTAMSFHDCRVKSRTLADLAGVLWDNDPYYSRELYVKSYNILDTLPAPSNGLVIPYSSSELTALRSFIISSLARKDSDLAVSLVDNMRSTAPQPISVSLPGVVYLRAGSNLAEDSPQKAVAFAQHALINGEWKEMIWLLHKLERLDQNAADSLFLQTVASLDSQSAVDANDLLMLGTYIFTSPADDCPADAVQMVLLDNLPVVNILANKPGRSPRIIEAYLNEAANILSRAVSDPAKRQLNYVAARQLVSKAQEFNPSILPQLKSTMNALASDIPPKLLEQSTYANLLQKPSADNATDSLREIASVPQGDRRDAKCLSLIFSSWRQGNFDLAQTISEGITNADLRTQLITLVGFGKAAKSIGAGDEEAAVAVVNTLPTGVERALLWLALASRYSAMGFDKLASDALRASTSDARNSKDIRQPLLLLLAGAQLSSLDPIAARTTLREAIRGFNSYDGRLRDEWSQRVQVSSVSRDFPLYVKGVEKNIGAALKTISLNAPNLTSMVIAEVKNEEIAGAGLVALCGVMNKPPQK